jgi:AAA domain
MAERNYCDEALAAAGISGGGDHGLVVRRASDIEPRAIDWIWQARIARGKHTAIAGEPGTGKSTLICEIIAAVTTGGEWPCSEGRAPIGSVVILSAEDDAEHTLVPRLMAAGANLDRVHIIEAVRPDGGKGVRSFNLQADIERLEKMIAEIGDVMLIDIDPISSYMGKADSHKNSEVRGVLEPVSKMAERTGAAVLSITHFSKASAANGVKALHRFIGSIAFTAAARFAFAVMAAPDDEDRRLFLHVKNNLAAPPQGLAFRLGQRIVGDPGKAIVASYVMWDLEPVSITANEALAAEASTSDQKSAQSEAEEFLRDLLASGPVPQKEVKAAAEGAGVAWATVRRAKDRLGIRPHKTGMGGGWLWSLSRRCSNQAEDAHTNNVSTFGKNEHLRESEPPKATPDDHPGIPEFLDRRLPCRRPTGRAPALGPAGDSLDEFE